MIWTRETYGVDHSWTESIKINTINFDYGHLMTKSDFRHVSCYSIDQQHLLWNPITFLVGAGILIQHSYKSYIYFDLYVYIIVINLHVYIIV